MGKSFLPTPQTFNAQQTQVLISDILTAIDASNKMSPVKTADFYCDLVTYFYPVSAGGFGSINAYLPPANSCFSKPYCFKPIGTAAVVVNRATGTSDVIVTTTTAASATTKTVTSGTSMIFRSDGINTWYVESVS